MDRSTENYLDLLAGFHRECDCCAARLSAMRDRLALAYDDLPPDRKAILPFAGGVVNGLVGRIAKVVEGKLPKPDIRLEV